MSQILGVLLLVCALSACRTEPEPEPDDASAFACAPSCYQDAGRVCAPSCYDGGVP